MVFFFLLSPIPYLLSIEVEGHITEDTTWSPDNNPYIVIHNIFVDAGVTLTILPGTIVQVYSALVLDGNHHDFYWDGGEAVAKMIWVDGKILAVGTEQEEIIFTRYQDDESNYRWGSIYFTEGSPESVFRYCKFQHSYKNGMAVGNVAQAALFCRNGIILVENCDFENNYRAIWLENTTGPMLIYKNTFRNTSVYPSNLTPFFISLNNADSFLEHNLLVARNEFYGRGSIMLTDGSYLIDYVYNLFDSVRVSGNRPDQGAKLSYGNYIINSDRGSVGISYSENDTCYVRKNTVINSSGVGVHGYHGVIADNYIEGCGSFVEAMRAVCDFSNFVYNNIVKDCVYRGVLTEGANAEVYNNLFIDIPIAPVIPEAEFTHLYNNVIYNSNYAIYEQEYPALIENNIFLTALGIIAPNGHDETAVFRYNCLTFPLPDEVTDAGGNILEDPMFADTLNGDFHLLPGSPCIDTGYDTTYVSTFDADYYHRVFDGLNDGNAVIDMGTFEFGSSFIGGIRGYVYDSNTDEPLDIVKLKINGQPPEYSDSLGFFEFKLHEGIYNIHCRRFYYDELSVNGIEVIDGEFTDIEIYLNEIVSADEENINHGSYWIGLSNYPNPFNSETTISFSFTTDNTESIEISIYNLKGQKVKEYSTFNNQSSISWDGTDNNYNPVSSGTYFYKLELGNKTAVKKMLLLR